MIALRPRPPVPALVALAGSLVLLPCSAAAQDASRAQATLRLRSSASQVELHSRVQLQARAMVAGVDRGAAKDVRYESTCGPVDDEGFLTAERLGACTVRARWTVQGREVVDSTLVQVIELDTVVTTSTRIEKKKAAKPPKRAASAADEPPPPPPPHPVTAPMPSAKPSPAPRPAPQKEEELPQFPWPPPRSTARAAIPRGLVTRRSASPGAETVDTLGEVADQIEAALDHAGIERSVYAIGDSGFVYVTRTEMIDKNGLPVPPPNRFPADVQAANSGHGFLDFIISRFRARPGYFRIIAIVVTSRPITADTAGLTVEQATHMVEGGMMTLPESLRRRAVTGLDAAALIYEYERRSEADSVRLRAAPLVSVDQHLAAAGLWSMSQLRKAP